MMAKEGEDCKTHQEHHKDLPDCGEGLTCRPDDREPWPPFPGKCRKEGKTVKL
jgi:hypothetical protein